MVGGEALTVIAGLCLIESEGLLLEVGAELKRVCDDLGLPFVLKGSFDKANRTSLHSARGPGMEAGLAALARARDELGVAVTTDVHLPEQVERVAEVVDLLQVPAFLCRQTDLLVACGRSGRPVNVKKGQFLSATEMEHVVGKLRGAGATEVICTDRGTTFGYNDLVADMRNLVRMRGDGVSVCFDATHAVQRPGGLASGSGGERELAWPLARAAVAVGVDAIFLEVHPDPPQALSDAATALYLRDVREVLTNLAAIDAVVR